MKGDFGVDSTIGPDSRGSDALTLSGPLLAAMTGENLCVSGGHAKAGAVLIPHLPSSEDRTGCPVDTRTQTGTLNMPLLSAAWGFSKVIFSTGLREASKLLNASS